MMKRTIVTLALATFAFACATKKAPPPKVAVKAPPPKKVEVKKSDHYGMGNAKLAAFDYKGAIASYTTHLQENPDDARALFNLGVAQYRAGDFKAAEKTYRKIISKDAGHEGATLNLGAVLRDKGDISGAISIYKKSLDKHPHRSKVLNNLSALYRKQKKYPRAIKMLRKLLMRDQKNVDAYKNLALVYYDQKKYTLALSILDSALAMAEKAGGKDPDILVNKGMIYLAKKENGRAMASFKEATKLKPDHLLANFNIGSLALSHRDYGMAERSLGLALKAWPNDFEVNVAYGFALQGLQKLPEAAAQLQKAHDMKPDDENIIGQLAVVLQGSGQIDKALAFIDKLLAAKRKTCADDDYEDPICARRIGLITMRDMALEEAAQPAEDKPETGKIDVFTEGDAAEDGTAEGAPPVEGKPGDGEKKAEGGPDGAGTQGDSEAATK